MKQEPFVIERLYNAPIQKVWKAITDKDQMKEWYFNLAEFRLEVGFEFEFDGGPEDRVYKHLCKITEVIPGRKLTYSWRYEGYEGNSFVTFELFPEGTMTRLRLTHEGLETFPASNPDFAKENFVAGWTDITGISLAEFVETTTIQKALEINAALSKVWDVLVKPEYNRQWAEAFFEGTYVETDWQKGSPVVWKTADGETAATGIVEENNHPTLLKLAYYDDGKNDEPGEYRETYSLSGNNDKTVLLIESGPLSVKHAKAHTGLWEQAIAMIKSLAES